MTQTSSEKVDQKVTQIISRGADPEILEEGYERQTAIPFLNDYATHPRSTETVVERAEAAIEQLSDDTDEEDGDE